MVVNEFVPKGTEWVELYNGGTLAQDLAGWYVTDTACGAPATTIPATVINPGEFFVVLSGAPGDNFSLSNDGDFVILCDDVHNEIDRVGYGTVGAARWPLCYRRATVLGRPAGGRRRHWR